MSRQPGSSMVPFLVTSLLLASVPAAAVQEKEACAAEVSVDLASQEERDGLVLFRFDVAARAAAGCSTLSYDLLIEEMLPNQQAKIVRMPREVELVDGSLSETVEHSMTSDLKMLGYEVSLVACQCRPQESPEQETRRE